MKFFGEEEVVSVDETSERLSGLEGSQRNRAIVVRDVLALSSRQATRGELKRGRGSESDGNIRFIWGCLDSSDDGNTGPLDSRRCGTWA